MTLKSNRLVKIRNLFEFILLQIFSQVNEIIETFFNNWSNLWLSSASLENIQH